MISKLAASIAVGLATFVLAVPTTSFAKSSNPKKSQQLLKQLKKLQKGAPFSKVQKLVKQLSQLDPAKANSYLKTGLTKLITTNDADKLTTAVNKVVQKSDLPSSKKKSITKQNDKAADNYTPPAPTPTPYQAMLSSGMVIA